MNGISISIDTTPAHAEELTRTALAAEGFGIVIEQTDGGVTVTAADPRQLLDNAGLDDLAADAADRLTRALGQVAAYSDANSGGS